MVRTNWDGAWVTRIVLRIKGGCRLFVVLSIDPRPSVGERQGM